MTTVFLYDDARARAFEPFASTRPVSEMVAGTTLIRERWKSVLGADDAQFIAGPRHADFDEPGTRSANGVIPPGSIIANARCVPALVPDLAKAERNAASCSMWRCGEGLAAVRARQAVNVDTLADGSRTLEDLHVGTGAIGNVGGWWLDEVWDFIRLLPEQLTADLARIAEQRRSAGADPDSAEAGAPPAHSTILGNNPVTVMQARGTGSRPPTTIEPHVVFDATAGPILVDVGSHVHAFTRLVGPCYIGKDVQVLGGDLSGCSIGDVCKVRGELTSTIVLGYSNKGHDGFIGHSYLGRWVNIGAGTITSNLKNTYGPVSLWTPRGIRGTGMQFLGTLFGDHVKTGIGLRLTTGTVIGAGANVYGSMPPKTVAPFSWGDAPNYSDYRADKFVETAMRMMARRHVELSDRAHRHLLSIHTARWTVESDAS